jgi:hypothetical protein
VRIVLTTRCPPGLSRRAAAEVLSRIRNRPPGRRILSAGVVAAGVVLAGCGSDAPTVAATGQATSTTTAAAATTPTTLAGRSYAGELVTTDGYRYRVTVALGAKSAAGGTDCPGAAAAGKAFVPVTLIVANEAADKPAPFPPLRVEMFPPTAPAGTKPAQVLLRDPTGACTFTPRVASIGPSGSVVFNGNSPAIDGTAGVGSAGRIQVSVSESTFTVVAPVP